MEDAADQASQAPLQLQHCHSSGLVRQVPGPDTERRYYQLTDAGQRALADFSDEWARFRDSVDAVLTTQGDGQ
jgi:DNA-binding PadR family transcriptional regulator